jgi:hypothetical protein
MKNIKNFDNFINEELHPDTYMSAADKLKKKGHSKRAKELTSFKDSLSDRIQPIEVESYGQTFTLDKDNIKVTGGDKREDDIDIFIAFDKELDEYLTKGDFESVWNNMSDVDKTKFANEYKELTDDVEDNIIISDEEKEKISKSNWSSLSQSQKDFFEEYADLNQHIIHFGFDWDQKERHKERKFYRDGLIIEDRRTAVKLLKFLKEYGRTVGGEVENCINMIGVNDMYNN